MAGSATDFGENVFAVEHGSFDDGIVGDHAAGRLEAGLKKDDGRDIGASEFILDAVAIRIGVDTEALGGLDSVVLIEGVVGELADGDHVGRLVPRLSLIHI